MTRLCSCFVLRNLSSLYYKKKPATFTKKKKTRLAFYNPVSEFSCHLSDAETLLENLPKFISSVCLFFKLSLNHVNDNDFPPLLDLVSHGYRTIANIQPAESKRSPE